MRSLLRSLLTILALLCGMSAGGGGGDSGVWILPLSSNVSATGIGPLARDSRPAALGKGDVVMQVSSDMGAMTASLSETGSGIALPIRVSGNKVVVPEATLQALLSSSSSGVALGVVVDLRGRGYVIKITRTNSAELTVEIY